MTSTFSFIDLCDQNINILIGSGASYGLFPTLELGIKSNDGANTTVESLATLFQDRTDPRYSALFMHYYKTCIEPVLAFDYTGATVNAVHAEVLENYRRFLGSLLLLLRRKKADQRKVCNLFTTNYDGCLAHAAEELWKERKHEFYLNDGTTGFKRRYLDARNFSTMTTQTGIFGRHRNEVSQINLIHLHGSNYWFKDADRIQVNYLTSNGERLVTSGGFAKCDEFSNVLLDPTKEVDDLPDVKFVGKETSAFWEKYDLLPIVNPTKWKFHETVFEEHYYQMLRYLSYELEKPHAVLLTFGFSFADEHIRQLVRRSLSNPSLQVYVCCYSAGAKATIDGYFAEFPNVQTIVLDDPLDFTAFNEQVFTASPTAVSAKAALAEGVAE
ncbi:MULTISPECIES: SIR2 family protein [unclassified Janthinobacterium]|uniref:SIR2 family protein n=1 Tax=unclassified Janthinobacterium TaxID=2610881 RepID=UPI00161B4726|nr:MULTISPECIES: SIR2 family protein [unclassified Janthinobacterium]MBB5371252.1 hypothetical protein [Janthinobacterium sp. K2C7]MBB5384058.1 hypothetical protein [Janthinobacterium sp. K2Li3]MBB5389482.1 hypothetical protein [Janthinobacterium sp. K2E3]